MRVNTRTILTLLLLAPVAGACAGGRSTEPAAPAPSAEGPTAAEMAEMAAIFRERRDSARERYTAADVAFMAGMIHHHAQALEMARLVPSRTSDPSMETLAARILNGQEAEIATMQAWLRRRSEPVPEVHIMEDHVMVTTAGQAGHVMHGQASGPGMPGMLTEAQLAELAAAGGEAFDRLFLELMIQHHRGAVTMVHELFATDGAAQDDSVFQLASDIQADQESEIARMERMLAAMQGGAAS